MYMQMYMYMHMYIFMGTVSQEKERLTPGSPGGRHQWDPDHQLIGGDSHCPPWTGKENGWTHTHTHTHTLISSLL